MELFPSQKPNEPAGETSAPRLDRRWIWLFMAGVLTLIRWLLAENPAFTEVAYTRWIYSLLRALWDYSLGWFPLPWAYAAPVAGGVWWFFFRKKKRRAGWRRVSGPLFSALAFAAGLYVVFMVTWGLNYFRMPLEHQLGMQIEMKSETDIVALLRWSTARLIASRAQIPGEAALNDTSVPANIENEVRLALTKAMRNASLAAPGRPRVKRLYPRGLLLQLGASGIYIPFVGEALVDAALPPATLPFTVAHEMSHGYGFAREDDCNFLAWLACAQSSSAVVRYSGELGLWRYVASACRRADPQTFAEVRDALPQAITADLRAIQETYAQYPGFFPEFSQKTYNRYLQSQGIRQGVQSYGRVVNLADAYRRQLMDP